MSDKNIQTAQNSQLKEMEFKKERAAIGKFRVTVDCVVFGVDFESGELKVVLVKRDEDPFKNCWSLPGGFVRFDEVIEDAARRKLKQKTGLENVFLEQLYTFDNPSRDPRALDYSDPEIERIMSIGYFALVSPTQHSVDHFAGGNASDGQWFNLREIENLGKLSFDHADIIQTALTRLRGKLSYVPIGFELLEEKFTLKQLQRVYEIILDKTLDVGNFRRKVLNMGILEPLEERQVSVSHRPASLFKFNKEKYENLVKNGLAFEI